MHHPVERPEDNEAVETERWCAGLISVGTAPIDEVERAELSRSARAHLVVCLWVGLAATALVGWPFLLSGTFWDSSNLTTRLASAAMFVSWLLGLPVAGMLVFDHARRYLRHLRELLGGEVEVFEGALDGGRLDPEQRVLLKGSAFTATPDGGQRLRVLPLSLTARFHARRGIVRWRAVRVRTVAAAPAYELRVAIPRESIGVDDPRVEILRRRMTADERREVLVRVARLRAAWKMLLLQALMGLILYAAIFRVVADHATAAILAVVGLAAWMVYRVRRPVDAMMLAGRLKRDAEAGLVLTHRRRAARRANAEAEGVEVDGSWVDVEFLPVSSLSWTVRGRPARWRDLLAPAWRVPWSPRH